MVWSSIILVCVLRRRHGSLRRSTRHHHPLQHLNTPQETIDGNGLVDGVDAPLLSALGAKGEKPRRRCVREDGSVYDSFSSVRTTSALEDKAPQNMV